MGVKMSLNNKLLIMFTFTFVTICTHSQDNTYQPSYNESEKQNNIQKLRELADSSHAKSIQSASNYNKAIFDAARQGYGGYSNINVEFDEKDKGLSISEKRSILNTRRNAQIMKEQLKGLE
jgi:hypothetical protein